MSGSCHEPSSASSSTLGSDIGNDQGNENLSPSSHALSIGGVIEVTGQTFEAEVLQSEIPVVVDFYADWCGPCRQLAPVLERQAELFAGKFKFVKINTDSEEELARTFQISGLPTVIFFEAGNQVGQFRGVADEAALHEKLQSWSDQLLTNPQSF